MGKLKLIMHELEHHIPFTFLASLIAIVIMFIVYFTNLSLSLNTQLFFEIAHPLHILVSVVVSSAIFYKYQKNFILAFCIGIISGLLFGILSDILFPYFGGLIFGLHPHFHFPLFESPILILSISVIGSLIGISFKITKLPHFLHVFLSVLASMFYLLAFIEPTNILALILSLIIVFIAVLIPCCLSDIAFPLFFIRKRK